MREVAAKTDSERARELYYAGKITAREYIDRVLGLACQGEQHWQVLVHRVEQSFLQLVKR